MFIRCENRRCFVRPGVEADDIYGSVEECVSTLAPKWNRRAQPPEEEVESELAEYFGGDEWRKGYEAFFGSAPPIAGPEPYTSDAAQRFADDLPKP